MSTLLFEAADVALILLPGNVRRMIVMDDHSALVWLTADATTPAPTRLDTPRIGGVSAPSIRTRISRVTHDLSQGFTVGRVPLQLSAFRPARAAKRQLDSVLSQVAQQSA